MNIDWENISFVYYGFGIFLILLIGVVYLHLWRKKRVSLLAENKFLKNLVDSHNVFRVRLKYLLKLTAFVFLILSAANPREYIQKKIKDIISCEIVLCLDISNSMLADDITPSRLEFSKQVLLKVLSSLGNDRVGMVVYAGSAAILQPLTPDINMVKSQVRSIQPDFITRQGTNIEEAIDKSISLFDKSNISSKVLLLVTDGEEHEGNLANLARKINDLNIKLKILGVGTRNGSPIPIEDKNGKDYKRDVYGNVVITKLDESRLKDIAKKTNGEYYSSNGIQQTANLIIRDLDNLIRTEESRILPSGYLNLYFIPLIIACILILVDLVILDFLYFLIK